MTSDRFARARDLFLKVCDLPAEQQKAILDEVGSDDPALRAEVDQLLHFHQDAPPTDSLELHRDQSPDTFPRTVAHYRLIQKIGEGGMGEVFEAEQERPVRRRVALKLIKWGMASKEVLARFEAERQALALMNHPNIARVFDAGAGADGRPYFAMEYVKGVPITEYCDTHRSSLRDRLQLFVDVCRGVQHAHHKGIIHRDLKPTNMLVAIQEDHPTPKIIDFGVAKATSQRLTERTVFTELGQWIGTPEYMSPEQAEMTVLDIDTRTDVYSLGVVLYELLVGAPPLDSATLRGSSFDGMRRMIREKDPPRPSTRVSQLGDDSEAAAEHRGLDLATLARELRGDLDWIVMKSLEKDRTRRYASPAELAEEIGRFLRHEPVSARPPSVVYRIGRFVRRHRLGVAAGALIAFAMLAGTLGTSVGMIRARQEAEAARKVSDFMVSMYADLNPNVMRGHVATPEAILDRAVERVEVELTGEPLVQARMLATLGHVYKELGLYDQSTPLLERAAGIRLQHLGADHPEYAMSISFLGDLHYELGDYDRARDLHEKALAVRRRALGPEHLTVAWSLRSLGNAHRGSGNHDTAISLLGQSAEILEKVLGPDHFDLSTTLYAQALAVMDSGDFEGALPVFERCLDIRERTLDPDHPELAVSLLDFARLLHRLGEPDLPLTLTRRGAGILERSLGADRPRTVFAMGQLAVLELFDGNREAAASLHERILDLDHRTDRGDLEFLRGFPEFREMELELQRR